MPQGAPDVGQRSRPSTDLWASLVVVVVALLLLGVLRAQPWTRGSVAGDGESAGGSSPSVSSIQVPVAWVSDGDTLAVRIDGGVERVRLIGIDAPEVWRSVSGPTPGRADADDDLDDPTAGLPSGECGADEATDAARALVAGGPVGLEVDPEQPDRDRYGRLLRHVRLTDGRSLAEVLIAGGFAREYTYDGSYEHRDVHRAAERAARDAALGIWSPTCR